MYEIDEIKLYKKNGLKFIGSLEEEKIIKILKYLDNEYYNCEDKLVLLDDLEYDILRDYAINKYGNNSYFNNIGSPIKYNEKVSLPIFMGSMNKIKAETNDLSNWLKKYKGQYIISAKLDGVSGLYVKENNLEKLYTRGDGFFGKDISYLIPFLNIPNLNKDIIIRGEFIISKHLFKEKYENEFSNIRNLVSGIINTKNLNERIKDVHFVIYELINQYTDKFKQNIKTPSDTTFR
jgi:NAD-dependent DNA ligase